MAGYEKISTVKDLLKQEMTVSQLAVALGRGPRTVFRYLELLRNENCGLRSHKKNGETVWVIQSEEKTNFNQEIVKQSGHPGDLPRHREGTCGQFAFGRHRDSFELFQQQVRDGRARLERFPEAVGAD